MCSVKTQLHLLQHRIFREYKKEAFDVQERIKSRHKVVAAQEIVRGEIVLIIPFFFPFCCPVRL